MIVQAQQQYGWLAVHPEAMTLHWFGSESMWSLCHIVPRPRTTDMDYHEKTCIRCTRCLKILDELAKQESN